MKTFLSILLVSLPTFFFAQDNITEKRHNIGVTLGYDSLNGLTSELRYDKYTDTGLFFRTAVFTNTSTVNGLKFGVHKAIIKNEHFDIDLGLNLRVSRYTDKFYQIEGESRVKRFKIGYEIPLSIRYHITPTVDFNLGISIINELQSNSRSNWNSGFNFGLSKGF